MNPSNLPTWAKLLIGSIIVAGNAVIPYLTAAKTVSPTTHAVIMGVAAVWLLVTNTFQAKDTPATAAAKVPPLPVFVLVASLFVGCSWFQSPSAPTTIGLGAKDIACVIANDTLSVPQIVQKCGLVGDVSTIVSTILDQSHANEAAAARAACLPYDAGAPIKPFVDAGAGK